jgi:hypothetical protein
MKNINEGSFVALFLETVGALVRGLLTAIAVGIVIFLLYLAVVGYKIRTAEAVEAPPTHFDIEYSVEGTKYVRTLSYATASLIEGTAKDYGINPAHLLAICIQEGSVPNGERFFACDPTAIGDDGMAVGAFQIHTGIHDVDYWDAQHIYFSARWTAERMLRYGYRKNPKFAMQAHNGVNSTRYGDTVWSIAKTVRVTNPNVYLP